MARYQDPDPLDLLFFAADAASRRARLLGANIHLVTEVEGELDLGRLKQAIAALHREYPVTAAKLVTGTFTGRPRWRLDMPPPHPNHVVQVHQIQPPTPDQWRTEFERLFATPIDAARFPPLRFHVLRGLAQGDVLVMRWPHALMDARGGGMMSEELDRLYEEAPDVNTLCSAGDETRDDFGALLARTTLRWRVQTFFGSVLRPNRQRRRFSQLVTEPIPTDLGRLRCVFRHFPASETKRIMDNAVRICGVARFPDFLRACALRALHEVMPHPVPPDTLYTTLNLLGRRNRRQPLRWCCNLTSALPLAVPAGLIHDRQRVADLFREQTGNQLASDTPLRHAAILWLFGLARSRDQDAGQLRPARDALAGYGADSVAAAGPDGAQYTSDGHFLRVQVTELLWRPAAAAGHRVCPGCQRDGRAAEHHGGVL